MGNKVIETPVARIEFKVKPSIRDIENLIYLLKAQALILSGEKTDLRRMVTSGK